MNPFFKNLNQLYYISMKSNLISTLFLVLLFQLTQLKCQTIYVSDTIEPGTIWNADTVKVIGDLYVPQGVKLQIISGTYIEFQGHFKLEISGSIDALGALNDTIVFTNHNTTDFFTDTLSSKGGWAGIHLHNSYSSPDSAVFEYCKIQFAKKFGEYAEDVMGGAVRAENFGNLIIRNSELSSNMVICYTDGVEGAAGGAIYCKNVNQILIENNIFLKNRSFDVGGAICINPGCHAKIDKNTFKENTAMWWDVNGGWIFMGGAGGAISTFDAFAFSPSISNNYCFNNQSVTGIIYTSNQEALVYNNVISNNYGVGFFDGHQGSVTRIFNNTIVNNNSYSGGIELFSRARVYNNICWGNERYPGQVSDQIHIQNATSGYQLFYNCVEYGNGGTNSIYEYPDFISPTLGAGLQYDGSDANWNLSDLSPCVNHGTADTTGLYIPATDIDDNPRIVGTSIEMGAFENINVITNIAANSKETESSGVYPNPGRSRLTVYSDSQNSRFQLFDGSGSLVMEKIFPGNELNIDVGTLKAGTYFYRIFSESYGSNAKTGKWIKIF